MSGLNESMLKVKWNEELKNMFKKLYTLGQFLLLCDISPKSETVDEKLKQIENDIKEEYTK
jgi:hypothetical protein